MDWKSYTFGAVSFYLFSAVLSGMAFAKSMPALNLLGQAYVGLTWPGALLCTATIGCDVLPPVAIAQHFFSF